jgi:hypothetical protein
MAIPAIQAEAGSVMLMAERNRLFRRNVLRGDVRGTLQLQQRRAYRGEQEYHSQDAGASQSICTAVKDLCH